MRNLKKILALALSLVMMLSVMSVASAKSLGGYSDAASVTAKHAVAVDVATQLGILQGMTENTYAPQGTLTRAQLATMIYRITTGDVKGTYVSNFAAGAAAKFSDVSADAWYAGYVGYCADAGYLKGMGDDTYSPNSELTGYQALAALLRAIGYNANNDFTGADWTIKVSQVATQNGMASGVLTDLNKAITREQAAQFVYNALFTACVSYTPALGYQEIWYNTKSTLAYDVFDIASDKDGESGEIIDAWGRPGTVWYTTYNTVAALIVEDAIASYTVATSECDIASAMGLKNNVEYAVPTYVNGEYNYTTTSINPVDYINKVGAQGRLVEVYSDRLVIIDTYLAQVTNVVPAKYDAAGHMISEATLCMNVYDGRATAMDCYITNGTTNYTYSIGDYILVNAWGHSVAQNENVKVSGTVGAWEAAYVEIVGLAPATVGAQTVIWQNAAKHTVAGTTYNDACQYDLDAAGNNGSAQFTWFFDQYNNLIGSVAIQATYTYATIANIQWMNPAAVNGYAQATLVYTDGTTESVVVYGIDKSSNVNDWACADEGEVLSYTWFEGDYADGSVSMNYGYNAEYVGHKLFAVAKNAAGIVTLKEVKTVVTADVTKGNPVVAAGVYIDDATQFLVRTGNAVVGYTYTPVTGYNQITSLKDAYVAYVNLDTDAPAEIVYMYGSNVTSPVANLVYIANDAYNWVAGDNEFITLLGAEIQGVNSPVVINRERLDGTAPDCVVGNLYHMVDTNGDGKVDTKVGEVCNEITTAEYDLGNGVKAKKIVAGGYKLVANAIEVTGEVVPYNNTTAAVYGGTLTGAENIVVVYKDYVVSAIYIVG